MSPGTPSEQSGDMQTRTNTSTPLRVYVVEDSVPIRERLETMITDAGATVAGHAGTVAGAIEGILAEHPALVIMDAQLADGTGFEVLRAIHRQEPGVDVYFCSSHSDDAYRQYAVKLGARGFFDKSSEFDQLREVVTRRAAATH